MKYKIYVLVSPDFLTQKEQDGYYIKTVHRHVLIPLDEYVDIPYGINLDFSSVEAAYAWLLSLSGKIREHISYLEVTVLPIIDIKERG